MYQERVVGMRLNKRKVIIIVFFSLILLYGMLTVGDYGVTIDEVVQRNNSLISYKKLVKSVAEIQTETVDFPSLPTQGSNYGVILQLPMVAIEHLTGFTMPLSQVFLMRHVFLFLFFWLSAIYFFRIGRMKTRNLPILLLGTLMYVFCPVILAHSYFNIKDGACVSAFTINLYYALAFMKKTDWKSGVGLIISSAICITTRIIGAEVLGLCLLFVWIRSIINWKTQKRTFFAILILGVCCVISYIAVTPAAWKNPIQFVINTVTEFSNYDVWDGDSYYLGQTISNSQLPWHYLPVWILFTVPSVYIILFIVGVIKNFVKGKRNINDIYVCILFFLPILYVILFKPTLYDSWRHFFFLWVPIAVIAFDGMLFLFQTVKYKKVSLMVCSVGIGFVIIRTVIYHPYEWSYFNPWIEAYAEDGMEKDIWNASTIELFDYVINETDDRVRMYIPYLAWGYDFLQQENLEKFEPGSREDEKPLDYIVSVQEARSVYDPKTEFYFYPREYIIKEQGLTLGAVYDANWSVDSYCTLYEDITEGTIKYNLNGFEWQYQILGNSVYLEGQTEQALVTDKITIETNKVDSLNEIYIKTQSGWQLIDKDQIHEHNDVYSIELPEKTKISGIRFSHEGEDKGFVGINFHKKDYQENEYGNSVYSPYYAVASDLNPQYVPNAVDGDIQTEWSSGSAQTEGMTYSVALEQPVKLSGLATFLYYKSYDCAQNLKISVSMDQENWTEISYEKESDTLYTFDPVECQYVKLELGESDTNTNWTINELIFYETK